MGPHHRQLPSPGRLLAVLLVAGLAPGCLLPRLPTFHLLYYSGYAHPDGHLYIITARKWGNIYGSDFLPSGACEVSLPSFTVRSVDEDGWQEGGMCRCPGLDPYGRRYYRTGVETRVTAPSGEDGPVCRPEEPETVLGFSASWPDATGFCVFGLDRERGVFTAQRAEWDPAARLSGAWTVRETREFSPPARPSPEAGCLASAVGPWRAVFSYRTARGTPYRTVRVDFVRGMEEHLLDGPEVWQIDRRGTLLARRESDRDPTLTIVSDGHRRILALPKAEGRTPRNVVPLFDRGLLSLDYYGGVVVIDLGGRVVFTFPDGLDTEGDHEAAERHRPPALGVGLAAPFLSSSHTAGSPARRPRGGDTPGPE